MIGIDWMADDPVLDVFFALTRFHRVLALGGDEFVHIAARTVDTHRRHIREKLRLSDSSAVLAYAIKWTESGKAI